MVCTCGIDLDGNRCSYDDDAKVKFGGICSRKKENSSLNLAVKGERRGVGEELDLFFFHI